MVSLNLKLLLVVALAVSLKEAFESEEQSSRRKRIRRIRPINSRPRRRARRGQMRRTALVG
jgi:hypothetical protein